MTIQSANNAVVYRMCTYVHGKHTEKTGLFPLKNVFEASENQVSHRSAVSVLKEYAPLVRSRACHFASSSNETEDLIQEGNIGLFSAYMNYDSSLSSFGTFAKRCIDAAMIDCLRKTHKLSSVPEDMKVDISGLEVADASPDPAHFVLVRTNMKGIWSRRARFCPALNTRFFRTCCAVIPPLRRRRITVSA